MVATVNGRVAGFVDGFLTLSADGVRRWEVDLLAVHPVYRNQGLASQLVMENSRAGFDMGADMARALIRLDNAGSQHTFIRCGYTCDQNEYALYVSLDTGCETGRLPSDAYLIPVGTINYRGLWVEGHVSVDGLRYAQKIWARCDYDLVGAVIPVSQYAAVRSAEDAGFALAGVYQWWFLKVGAAPAPR
jgi:GNAT superfamily N-acetyltransferase